MYIDLLSRLRFKFNNRSLTIEHSPLEMDTCAYSVWRSPSDFAKYPVTVKFELIVKDPDVGLWIFEQ